MLGHFVSGFDDYKAVFAFQKARYDCIADDYYMVWCFYLAGACVRFVGRAPFDKFEGYVATVAKSGYYILYGAELCHAKKLP